MKEHIHTIPLSDAFLSGDECPFCYIERETEQRLLRYVLGPSTSYMEPDMRETTTSEGFCRAHYKKMFDFSNALGNALIMQSYMNALLEELEQAQQGFQAPGRKGLFAPKKTTPAGNALLQWAQKRHSSCFICNRMEQNMSRYFATFFHLLKEEEFRHRVENCKGFCVGHFGELMDAAQTQLPEKHRAWFYATIPQVMQQNLQRVKGDLDWFTAKFDYRNAHADWKNSKDAVQRTMQKLQGGYPADPPFRDKGR